MTEAETLKLLLFISTLDNRDVTSVTSENWHKVIGDVPYEIAEAAVIAWFQHTTDYFPIGEIGLAWTAHREELGRRIHKSGAVFDGFDNQLEPVLDVDGYPSGQYRHTGRPDLDQLAIEQKTW